MPSLRRRARRVATRCVTRILGGPAPHGTSARTRTRTRRRARPRPRRRGSRPRGPLRSTTSHGHGVHGHEGHAHDHGQEHDHDHDHGQEPGTPTTTTIAGALLLRAPWPRPRPRPADHDHGHSHGARRAAARRSGRHRAEPRVRDRRGDLRGAPCTRSRLLADAGNTFGDVLGLGPLLGGHDARGAETLEAPHLRLPPHDHRRVGGERPRAALRDRGAHVGVHSPADLFSPPRAER